jgi:diguanylate cyclase (GGDEF)-like protein
LYRQEDALGERETAVRQREQVASDWAGDAQVREEALRVEGDRSAAVDTQNSELRDANEHLVLATIEAQELREAAQTARRRQDEFLAMLAHELRNPLGPIRNAVEVLARLDGRPVPQPVLDVIRRQVQQMARLLDDLLDVSRVTQGKVTLQRRPTELSEFINQAVEATSALVKERGQQLMLELPAVPLHVDGDEVRLAQVFSNLLHNASKYTQVGGAITLRAERKGESVVIRVIDNGMGISVQALPHVFELFSQDERALARNQGGLGIGLTVVRSMVELHQGSVEVFSDGSAQGSEFVVTLPRLEHRGEAEMEPSAVGLLAPTPARILLIEDNVDAGESLAELLRLSGHEVVIARDGLAGLALFDRFNPHVVLCDIGLPGPDGYEVALRMRERRPTLRPVMVALTGYGNENDRQRGVAAGFDHHVVKPANPELLLRIIDSAMRAESGRSEGGRAEDGPTAASDPVLPAPGAQAAQAAQATQATQSEPREAEGQRHLIAAQTIAHLRGQVDALRQQVLGLIQALAAAERPSDDGQTNGLVEANGALVLSALHADEVAESAVGDLVELMSTVQRDVLTGTPNRALMLDRLESAMALSRRRGTRGALLFVDLDGFKQINDTLGHAVGDTVLCLVARRLEAVVRDSDTVSRHGGDEFMVLLSEISHPADAALIATKMLQALGEAGPGALPAMSASVGIAIFPEDAQEAELLITHADTAMYKSKKGGRARFAFYNDVDGRRLSSGQAAGSQADGGQPG